MTKRRGKPEGRDRRRPEGVVTRRLELSGAERTTLEQAVRHHPKPYVRERAAALVKVADRTAASWVAEHGLLKAHAPDTVYRWRDRAAPGARSQPSPC